MNPTHERTARDLNAVARDLHAHADIRATDDGVLIPLLTARSIVSAISFVEGGSRVPFVRSLLGRGTVSGELTLRGDEGRHLCRALEDIVRQSQRNARIDRGQIPGALSGSELNRLIRKHPQLFTRGRA